MMNGFGPNPQGMRYGAMFGMMDDMQGMLEEQVMQDHVRQTQKYADYLQEVASQTEAGDTGMGVFSSGSTPSAAGSWRPSPTVSMMMPVMTMMPKGVFNLQG